MRCPWRWCWRRMYPHGPATMAVGTAIVEGEVFMCKGSHLWFSAHPDTLVYSGDVDDDGTER